MSRLLACVLISGCASLDSFVFDGLPCSAVGEATCTAYGNVWDDICTPCDQPYDWGMDYPWIDGTLAEGQTVRAIEDVLVEQLTIPTDDGEGELDAYFLTSHRDDLETAEFTIVYNHGNFGNIEPYIPRVRFLHEAGYNVFIWDYRGYGKSTPEVTPTAAQHLADAATALDRALELAPDPDRTLVYGYSIGSLAATQMAIEGGTCALALESAFTSLGRTQNVQSTLSLGERFFSSGLWDNYVRMAEYRKPVLGMTGTDDHLFPPDDVRDLVEAGSGPTVFWQLDGVDHGISSGGVPEAGLDAYLVELHDFLVEQHCL